MGYESLDVKVLFTDDNTVSALVGRASSAFGKIKSEIEKSGQAFAAIGASLTGLFGLTINEAGKAEESNLRLSQAIRLSGLSMSQTQEQVRQFAGSMQAVTGMSDELVQDFVSRMLPVTKDVGQAFRATQIAMDFAAGSGRDLSSVEQIMTQVMSGNIEMLRRQVPALRSFSDEQLSAMTAAQRTELALSLLQNQFGGMAATIGGGVLAQIKGLWQDLGNVAETIGGFLIPRILDFTKNARETARSVDEWLQKNQGLAQTLTTIVFTVGTLSTAVGGLLLILPMLIERITAVITLAKTLQTVLGLSAATLGTITAAVTALVAAIVFLKAEFETLSEKSRLFWQEMAAQATKFTEGMTQLFLLRIPSALETFKSISLKVLGEVGTGFQRAEVPVKDLKKAIDDVGTSVVAVGNKWRQTWVVSEVAFKSMVDMMVADSAAKEDALSDDAMTIRQVWEDTAHTISYSMSQAITDVMFRGENFADSMVNAFQRIAESIIMTIIQMQILNALTGGAAGFNFFSAFHSGGQVPNSPPRKYHSGGLMTNSGEFPVMVEGGEYIVRKEMVPQALPLLEEINSGRTPGGGGITIQINNYGDIKTEKDEAQLFRSWGEKIREAVRGSS